MRSAMYIFRRDPVGTRHSTAALERHEDGPGANHTNFTAFWESHLLGFAESLAVVLISFNQIEGALNWQYSRVQRSD